MEIQDGMSAYLWFDTVHFFLACVHLENDQCFGLSSRGLVLKDTCRL